ncbi:MAG: alginate O-acetyltransferase AlgX-related protein, partial [Nitrospiraceae bacterium]
WSHKSLIDIERHENFSKLERTLQAMQQLTAARGLEVTVFILPTKGEVYRWMLNQRVPMPEDQESSGFARAVLKACERAKLRCLDAKPYLYGEADRLFQATGSLLWWRDDTHMGELGHEAMAALIARDVLHQEYFREM